MKTKDGHELKPGQQVTLYRGRTSITGEIHHYGAEGWQIGINGPFVKDLYYDQINALFYLGIALNKQVADIIEQMKEIHANRINKRTTDCHDNSNSESFRT